MKAITLHQPWASLLVAGEKRIETRSWATSYRGPIAVHAAQRIGVDACFEPLVAKALLRLGFERPEDLPLGKVLGQIDLLDCLEMGAAFSLRDPRLTPSERAFGTFEPGRFAWLTRPRSLAPVPFKAKGYQRIWNLGGALAGRVGGSR